MESEQLAKVTTDLDTTDDTDPTDLGADMDGASNPNRTDGAIVTDLDLELDLEMPKEALYILRIPLTDEMRQELDAVIHRREWEREEGLVTVLATGISQLSAQDRQNAPVSAVSAVSATEATALAHNAGQAELDPVTQELAYYHAMYSAMKFRAFSLLEKLKVVELRERGLRGMVALNKKWADKVREQIEDLKVENTRLKEQIVELRQASPVQTSAPAQSEAAPAMHSMPNNMPNKQGLLAKLQAFLSSW